jgi:hypothetical protein
VRIRPYTEGDLDRVLEMHRATMMGYDLPHVDQFFSKQIVEHEGKVGMAAMLKLNAEVYLLCDPKWRTPAWRLEAIRQLHFVCNDDARDAGAKEAVAFIPPAVEGVFTKRLAAMGWSTYDPQWKMWYREIV